jgi:hypothetical protein
VKIAAPFSDLRTPASEGWPSQFSAGVRNHPIELRVFRLDLPGEPLSPRRHIEAVADGQVRLQLVIDAGQLGHLLGG